MKIMTGQSSKEVSYNEFIRMVDAGEVESVLVDGDKITIFPKEKEGETITNIYGQKEQIIYYTGVLEDETLTQRLIDKKVEAKAAMTDSSGLLISFILTYIVPITNSISNVDNAIQTIDTILEFDETANINLVLNRCPDYDFIAIKEKFKALFGNDEFNLPSRVEEFQNKVKNINYILETDLPDIISSKHQYSLLDAYLKAKLIMENIDSIEASWLEEGKDVYLKNKKLNRINEHIYKYCNTFIENFKLD
jgi:hypothetical protein